MRLKRLAVTACLLLVAVFSALAIAVQFLDPRSLAVSLAASVKADTGRELTFGEVGVNLLPRPALVLSEVRFANAMWGSQPWLARAGRLSADIDALALLSGRLRIENIAVTDGSVFLETDRNGIGNWVMGSESVNNFPAAGDEHSGGFSGVESRIRSRLMQIARPNAVVGLYMPRFPSFLPLNR